MKAETVLGEVDMLTVICIFHSLEWIKRRGKEIYQGAEIGVILISNPGASIATPAYLATGLLAK